MKQKFQKGEIVIYKSKEGPELKVRLEDETVWLTQKQMAMLFDKGIPTINEHIKNIFKEGELKENSVIRKFRITAAETGKHTSCPGPHYSPGVRAKLIPHPFVKIYKFSSPIF